MDVFEIPLTAGVKVRLNNPGRFFMIAYAAQDVTVKFFSRNGTVHYRAVDVRSSYRAEPGDWSNPEDHNFDGFDLTSATNQTIKVGVSFSRGDYDSPDANEVTVTKGATLPSTADVTLAASATLIKAANANRRYIHVTNLAASNTAARIGDASVGAARGLELQPGSTLTLENTAAVYGYAGSATVSVLEEED